MSDPNSKNDDKTAILPLGQPALSAEFTEFRNMVLTSISTEEAERVLVEMSHDLSSFTFDEDEQAVDFNETLLPAVSPGALPSSQILAEGGVEAADGDFAGFEALELDENSILAQIEERVVDLENTPAALVDEDIDTVLEIPGFGGDTLDEGDDLSGFNDLNMGELNLDAEDAALDGLDFQDDFTAPAIEAEASPEAPVIVDTPAFTLQESTDDADSEADAVDASLLGLDFGDDPVVAVKPEGSAEFDMPFEVAAVETPVETLDFELPDMDFETPGEPAKLEAQPEEDVVDAFDPAAFDLPAEDEEIATEAFTPDFGAQDEDIPAAEVDEPIDLAMFDEPEAQAEPVAEQDDVLDLGIPDFQAQDEQRDTFAVTDTYAVPEDDFIVPSDDEPVDMVAVISSEREISDDVPPVYDALEGERVVLVEEVQTVETVSAVDVEEVAPVTAVDEAEPVVAPIFAEKPKKQKKRWLMPIAASVAVLALAAGGGYYYYSIGTPGLEQYLGGQRPITVATTETMPGTDVSQVVLPQDFEPVTEQAPLDPGQGSVVPDLGLGEVASLPAPTPVEATPEIAALFAELDAAVAAPVTPVPPPLEPVDEVATEPALPEASETASIDDMPEIEEFDLGLTDPEVAVDSEPALDPEATGEVAAETTPAAAEPPSAVASAPAGDPDLASIVEVQEMFAEQLITLQADIEDLKSASFTAPGQANVMGEMMLEVTRLAEQMAVVNARLMGVEGRVASAPAVTLPGANSGNDEALRRLEQQMELLSNNVGIIARMAAGSSNSPVPGFNAVTEAPVAPTPAPRPPAEAPRVSDSPNEAAGFTISSKPTNASALGRVAKGDFVEDYGYVLDVMPISGGGKLVQMENGTVLVE